MNNNEAIYAERIGYSLPVRVIFVASCLICAAVCIFVPLTIGNLAFQVVFSIVGLLFILILIDFWWLVFRITATDVTFGFGVLKKVIPRSRILSCEPHEIRFKNYLGYGIRWVFTLDGTTGYIVRSGRGVKMIVDGHKRPFVVSVDNPGRVCELISQG